ncbi:MAG TPA: hemolysin family protein [Lacipirellulaceae bacterium]|nr:hemolysin family protein [Lacipirellulaceae bacterium]
MLWEILFILVLVFANGLFAAAETSLIAARKGRLEQRAEEGNRNARRALELARNPDLFLPTAQIGITLVSAFGAAYGGHQIVQELGNWLGKAPWPIVAHHADGIALAIFVACFTYVSLILGELVPKRISLHRAERIAILLAPILQFIAKVARPIIWFMGLSTSGVLRALQLGAASGPTVSLDDIEHLIGTGTAEGVVEPLEQKLALEALRLGDRTVREIMRPRIDLDAMDVDTPSEEILGTVAMAGFSRLPVYEGDLDHVLGFVHIKDLFRQQYLGWPIELRKMLHPALFVPENMTLDRLLKLFQEKHNQLAVVLNEYGGTEGMVTLEDVVEEIVGEMRDEFRRYEEQKFVQRNDNTWLLDGAVSVADMIERLDIVTDDSWEGRGFSTIAGLILDRLGRIPAIGDKTDWDGLILEVVDMDGKRIDRVLVTRKTLEE